MDERIIRRKLDMLRARTVLERTPITGWEARIGANPAPGKYTWESEWTPIRKTLEAPALKTVQIRTRTPLPPPPENPELRIVLEFSFRDLESLLFVDGAPWAGIDKNHARIPVPPAGDRTLEIEAVALPRAWSRPELRHETAAFHGAALVTLDRSLERAVHDLAFTWEAARVIPDQRRRQRVAAALEEALLLVDVTAPTPALRRDAHSATERLHARLTAIAPDPEGGAVHLAGHTHIDTAWLWPVRETVRKCARTFSTAVRLMEQYPDFHFSCSQAQLYRFVKEYYPTLYRDIRKWVEAGRWHTTGALWVEADCNVPSGESLVRQVLYGLEFFQNEFGARPRTCWLPDVFGYPGNLPQILKGCGLDYFFTCKLHWQSTNPFPHHLFWWEGIDGSRVLAHIPKLASYYNGFPRPEQLQAAWEGFQEKALYGEVLLPFGYGDGGGGPTPEMLEFAARAAAFPGLPAAHIGGEEDFFDHVAAEAPELPAWQGELYLETHRGTYTSQARIKKANRRAEQLLHDAELWAALAQMTGTPLDAAPLHQAWRLVLLQQFHDILPGSSIGEVYADALADFAQAEKIAATVRDHALDALATQAGVAGEILAFNSLSENRSDPFEVTLPVMDAPFHIVDAAGRECPFQELGRSGGFQRLLVQPATLPALGAAGFHRIPGAPAPAPGPSAWDRGLENDFFRIELAEDGTIRRLLDKRSGREVLPENARANDWQIFQDGPEREAAWNVHETFEKRRYPFTEPAAIEIVETGPVRAALRITRKFRNSLLRCEVRIYRTVPRIDFAMDVDWQERHAMLKAAFPVAVRSPQAAFEIQFGAIQRPTHRNTSWERQKFEVAAQYWADLSEAGYGVALLNDSKYGYDVKGNVLRITLLRGPDYPDPEADRGRHQFTYSLLPHANAWQEAGVVRRAKELNFPATARVRAAQAAAGGGEPARSFCNIGGRGAVLETLKPAHDGDGWILRVYESHGGRSPVRIEFERPIREVLRCNLVEENTGEHIPVTNQGFSFYILPFQVQTFRIRT